MFETGLTIWLGWPQTRQTPALASRVLGIQASTATPGSFEVHVHLKLFSIIKLGVFLIFFLDILLVKSLGEFTIAKQSQTSKYPQYRS